MFKFQKSIPVSKTVPLLSPVAPEVQFSKKGHPIPKSTPKVKTPPTPSTSSPSPSREILNLCPEILTQVFAYLNTQDKLRVASTCKYFYGVLTNPVLWTTTEAKLSANPNSFKSKTFNFLNQRGITRIQVQSFRSNSLQKLTSSVQITHLKLSGCDNFTNSCLNSMQNLNNLVTLDLSFCTQITDYSFVYIIEKAPLLETLHLKGCCKLTDLGVLLISYGLRNLTLLDLGYCFQLTNKSLSYLSGNFSTLKFKPKVDRFLTKVGLVEPETRTCFSYELRPQYKYDLNLKKIDEFTEFGMHRLDSLAVDIRKISDHGLRSISRMTTISKLNLGFCVNITNRGLSFIKRLKKLQKLVIRLGPTITDEEALNFARQLDFDIIYL